MNSKNTIYLIMPFILLVNLTGWTQHTTMDTLLLLERNVMNAPDEKEKAIALLLKADYNMKNLRYKEAITTMQRVAFLQLDTSQRCHYYYQKALAHVAVKEYAQALPEALDLKVNCGITNPTSRLLYRMVLLENEKWEEFNEDTREDPLAPRLGAIALLESNKYVRSASWLPGLGLMQLGYWGKGMSSLGLSTALLGWTAYNAITGFYITSALSGFYEFRNVYRGGKRLTEVMVEEENKKKTNQHKRTGWQYLLRQSSY